jgi:hypothetical protein
MLYKLRVLIDYEKDVFREILIRSDQHFIDLNYAIIKAFQFSGDQMSSFYISNEDWEKGEEIVQFEMDAEDEIRSMENTRLDEIINAKNKNVLFVYDFLRLWIFYIELISINKNIPLGDYPVVIASIGTPPNEEEKSIDFEMPSDHIGEDDELDPELRELLGGGDDDDDESDYIDPDDMSSYY